MCSEGCTAGHCSGAPFLCLECWPSPLTCLSISAEGRKPLGEGMSHWNQFVPGLKQFDGSYIAACSVMDDFFANLEKRVAPFELVPPADLQWHTSDPQHSYPLLPPPTQQGCRPPRSRQDVLAASARFSTMDMQLQFSIAQQTNPSRSL